METYLIMVNNRGSYYPYSREVDRLEALRLCKELNEGAGEGCDFFVVRTTDGMTWVYYNGGIYRFINHTEGEIRYKEVAI